MARCGASVHVRDPLPPSKPRVLLPVRVLGHSTVCVALCVLVCMSRRVGVSRKRARPLSRGGTIESDELYSRPNRKRSIPRKSRYARFSLSHSKNRSSSIFFHVRSRDVTQSCPFSRFVSIIVGL